MMEGDERDPPFFFQKPTDAIVQDGGVVPYPPFTDDFQFEVELVAAIGKGGRSIPVRSALDHVFGYAVGIDLTRRDRQREARERMLPWEVGKSFDRSAPCSKIYPMATSRALNAGTISLTVNGAPRQTGKIEQMIWSVPEIVANLSNQYALEPGDLIFTGTPAGVGAVLPGDKLVGTIEGLGSIEISIGNREE
jgi:fumarylpyruvate hydrolase